MLPGVAVLSPAPPASSLRCARLPSPQQVGAQGAADGGGAGARVHEDHTRLTAAEAAGEQVHETDQAWRLIVGNCGAQWGAVGRSGAQWGAVGRSGAQRGTEGRSGAHTVGRAIGQTWQDEE